MKLKILLYRQRLSDMVGLLGEVPIWFVSLGKSRYSLFPGGIPEMVLSLGEFPRCDVTPHIGEKRAQKIILWKTRFTIYSFHKMEKTYSFHKMITIISYSSRVVGSYEIIFIKNDFIKNDLVPPTTILLKSFLSLQLDVLVVWLKLTRTLGKCAVTHLISFVLGTTLEVERATGGYAFSKKNLLL